MAEKTPGDKLLYCSFCGKSQHEVRKLIAGPSVFICDECIELCNDIIREEGTGTEAARADRNKLPTPHEIRHILDTQYALARHLIETERDKVEAIAQALLEWETIYREQMDDIMEGRPPRPPKDWTPTMNRQKDTPPVKVDNAPAAA